ncbi:hypothetical protein AB9P05_00490 [Roseivirga sp. BDSF3-8]|uniref:hypothetical protein n=1 Tax=Roseivirga sp. BDSF3-8 TaxID=3241598 RepID=UPI0035321470
MTQNNIPKFQIQTIDVQEVTIKQPQQNLGKNPNLNFDIHLDHAVMQDNDIFIAGTTITTYAGSKEHELARFKANCVYKIDNMAQFQKPDKSGVSLPEELISAINSVSVSTTRGLMFGAFGGTYLQKVVLPIIDTQGFAPNS